jgi:uncharacterized protein
MKNIILLITCLFSLKVFALSIPPTTHPVIDLTNQLSKAEKDEIGHKSQSIYKKNIAQVRYLIIPSLENEVLEEYSIRVANEWKLGDKELDNGLLVLIAMKERKIRIEVGSGLEGVVTDIDSSRIIDQMKSYMRNKDLKEALNSVLDQVIYLSDYNSPEKKEERRLEAERKRKEQAEFDKEVKNVMYLIFSLAIFLMAIIEFFKSIKIKSRAKELEKEINSYKEENTAYEKLIKETKSQVDSIKLESNKIQYHSELEEESRLNSRKRSLENEISKMKRYLGV